MGSMSLGIILNNSNRKLAVILTITQSGMFISLGPQVDHMMIIPLVKAYKWGGVKVCVA